MHCDLGDNGTKEIQMIAMIILVLRNKQQQQLQ